MAPPLRNTYGKEIDLLFTYSSCELANRYRYFLDRTYSYSCMFKVACQIQFSSSCVTQTLVPLILAKGFNLQVNGGNNYVLNIRVNEA